MGGGILQLVARGYEDLYLTSEPQITFFKLVYRRHTNFTIEPIPHLFQTNKPTFGDTVSCVISRNADLVGSVQLVVKLPKINLFSDPRSKFAWVRKVGFALIKSVEVVINGRVIDKHYGEWLNLWAELTGDLVGNKSDGFNKMIGNVPDNYNFSSSKESYLLYIPLQFWFCRNSGNAIPIINLQYSDIKINVEFETAENCYMLGPSHYIKCYDDIVNFKPYEYIEQTINGITNAGIFIDYDIERRNLYYYKLTNNKLIGMPIPEDTNPEDIDISQLSSSNGIQYQIIGKTSQYTTYPEISSKSITYTSRGTEAIVNNLNFEQCFLLIDYYYLDEDERYRFSQSKFDYLIEQVYTTPNVIIDNIHWNPKIITENPCKLQVWVSQLAEIYNSKDYFNYSDSYQRKLFNSENYDVRLGYPIGKSLISNETILYNGNERITKRPQNYFSDIQSYQYTKYDLSPGINFYSYSLYPFMAQPSGTANTSQFDNIQIAMDFTSTVKPTHKAFFRCYCVCYNILRFVNGLAGLVFIK